MTKHFNIHGDNIIECVRAFKYIVAGLGQHVIDVAGPNESVSCPVYVIKTQQDDLQFQFFPGYGERRWNRDILGYIKRTGGRLREAADAILTRIEGETELPVVAIEFCGALPAGNQAWQRQGRAFSFAHAGIPFFYVAELGGYELDSERGRRAERLPNPAIPFSFATMTHYQKSVCLPVYEANPGTSAETQKYYSSVFGKDDFLKFLSLAILGEDTDNPASDLEKKSLSLVKLLASSRRRNDGLTAEQWQEAHEHLKSELTLPDYLSERARLTWKKTAYIAGLTSTAKKFMAIGAEHSLGLTSKTLPLSFVPAESRSVFADAVRELYPDLDDRFFDWLGSEESHLAIAWVMGFKPAGDDARPDRGLPPLARMLVGDGCDLMTFVYGPANESHWLHLERDPAALATRNGLWEAILGVSDGVLVDSSTKPKSVSRGHLKESWYSAIAEDHTPLLVEPKVRALGEQDVDTALHVAFDSLGLDFVFEGMCNPPGGDWSGISFRWTSADPEHRWLTLPRVSATGAKRPDHVFAIFNHGDKPVCLCIESKERAQALEKNIGPRLTRYTEVLFESAPSIHRKEAISPWELYEIDWERQDVVYLSAGAYLSAPDDPFHGLPKSTSLDLQIGVSFSPDGQECTLHFRGDTDAGRALSEHLSNLETWGSFVKIEVNN